MFIAMRNYHVILSIKSDYKIRVHDDSISLCDMCVYMYLHMHIYVYLTTYMHTYIQTGLSLCFQILSSHYLVGQKYFLPLSSSL